MNEIKWLLGVVIDVVVQFDGENVRSAAQLTRTNGPAARGEL